MRAGGETEKSACAFNLRVVAADFKIDCLSFPKYHAHMKHINLAVCVAIPLVVALGSVACRKPADRAGAELAEAGYDMTADGWMRACAAGDLAAAKRFLEADFDLDARDASGDGGMHAAASHGHQELLKWMLDRGIAVDALGGHQRTPLMVAVLADQTATVRWLLRQGASPKLRDADGYTPLMLAVREGKVDSVAELAGHSRDELDDALLLAALVGQAGVIDTLTNYGASVFARMDDGRTALMLAAENGHLEAAEMLVELGASRNSTANDGRTASERAGDAGFPEVQMVIERTVREVAIRLDSAPDLIAGMEAHVEQAGESPQGGIQLNAATTDEPVVLLEGASVSVGANAVASGAPATPPLVMRHFQQRELPVRIQEVRGESAVLEIRGGEIEEVRVAAGDTLPGSTIEVVRVGNRIEQGKLNDGEPIEIGYLEVRDTRSGQTRTWFANQPVTTHEPAALVEDVSSGRRYVALPGQRFTSEDGRMFVVSDVRPNQLIVIEEATGMAYTLPLRGARG